MSFDANGKTALKAILANTETFSRIKPADYSAVAIKLAKKQVIAAGQTIETLNALKGLLGEGIFERTLDTLTAFQAKQLAKRIDETVTQETIASCSMALVFIRAKLSGDGSEKTIEPKADSTPTEEPPKKNKYLGRKAFRTGR